MLVGSDEVHVMIGEAIRIMNCHLLICIMCICGVVPLASCSRGYEYVADGTVYDLRFTRNLFWGVRASARYTAGTGTLHTVQAGGIRNPSLFPLVQVNLRT